MKSFLLLFLWGNIVSKTCLRTLYRRYQRCNIAVPYSCMLHIAMLAICTVGRSGAAVRKYQMSKYQMSVIGNNVIFFL